MYVLNDHILTVAAVQEQRTTRQRQYLDEIVLLRVASSDASRNDEYINSLDIVFHKTKSRCYCHKCNSIG